jgi:heavy metal translocating P-type ATPase
MDIKKITSSLKRDYVLVAVMALGLFLSYLGDEYHKVILLIALIGAYPTFYFVFKDLLDRKITIDTFNFFVVSVSLVLGEIQSVIFISLMFACARILDERTEAKMRHAVEQLLALKPEKAFREVDGVVREVKISEVKVGDVIVIENGESVPVDGIVIFGSASINESSVTGESVPKEKIVGDHVLSGTVNESGIIKIRATKVGGDTTVERMIRTVEEASKHKSQVEETADTFAKISLPIVMALGVIVYFLTKNISMMAAIFLVACVDDLAVSIPLAVTAALGMSAKRGVVIKGGKYVSALSKVDTLVVDKTGTLTYGTFSVKDVYMELKVHEKLFWKLIGSAEKYSSHPIARALLKESINKVGEIPDPDKTEVFDGSGIKAKVGNDEIAIGNENLAHIYKVKLSHDVFDKLKKEGDKHGETTVLVFLNKSFAGMITLSDTPRPEAKLAIGELIDLGVKDIYMFTGDNENVAKDVSSKLGINHYKSKMMPEDKLIELEKLSHNHVVCMVGDGVNDTPSLARADVSIAIGSRGVAAAIETADVVLLRDDLKRIPEVVKLSKKTISVIHANMFIWALSNVLGFSLVLFGIIGPAGAAFYNFATDFLPLINSARLFIGKRV